MCAANVLFEIILKMFQIDYNSIAPEELSGFRTSMYGFLAACYLRPPDENIIIAYNALLPAIEGFKPVEISDKASLTQEFHDLFKVPLRKFTTPYESAFLSDGSPSNTGAIRQSLRKIYAAVEFTIPPEFHEMPDHIGIELSFMHLLCAVEKSAVENGQTGPAENCRNNQKRFLQEHMHKWAGMLAEKVKANSAAGFYTGVAEITQHFVALEAK